MRKYLLFCLVLILSTGVISCGKQIQDYPVSEAQSVVSGGICLQLFGDEPNLDNVFFTAMNVQEYSEEVILEGYDGETWHVLFNSVEDGRGGKQNVFSRGEAALLEYNEAESGVMSIDLSGAYEQFGAGKYRILKSAVIADTNEKCYVAKEIVLLDEKVIEKKQTLRELLYNTDVASMELIKGSEVILMDSAAQAELLEFTMDMQCVGTQDISLFYSGLTMGGDVANFYTLILYMEDGSYVTVHNSQGKDLEDNEYCAICTISGMNEVVLLYSEQEWVDVLAEKIQ